jgi:hypothetical protein
MRFVALVSFEGRIEEKGMPPPRVWIVPFPELQQFIREYPGGRINVRRDQVLRAGGEFENAWHLIEGRPMESGDAVSVVQVTSAVADDAPVSP